MAVRNKDMSEISCKIQYMALYLTSYLIQPITETAYVTLFCMYKYEYIRILAHNLEKF